MAAPTVSLYVPSVSAPRMAPCPVNVAIDFGEVEKSIVNSGYTWSNPNVAIYQVNNGDLDAHETFSGSFDRTNNGVRFSSNTSAFSRYNAELIFPGVSVPSAATIVSATLELWIGNSGSDDPNCLIYGEDTDSAADFLANGDILGRTKTAASVEWVDAGVFGGYVAAPDIASIVNEIKARTGEIDNANVGIILEGKNDSNLSAIATSYNSNPAQAAKLTIITGPSVEYRLDTPIAELTRSGDAPSNVVINENGSPMAEGTVGSLAAGEWGQSGGYIWVRLSDDADPSSKADGYVDISFDVSLTNDPGVTWDEFVFLWSYAGVSGSSVSTVPDLYRYCTDPRPGLDSRQIDMTGNDTTSYNRPQGFGTGWVMVEGEWEITLQAIAPNGDTDTATKQISIAPNTRTQKTVGSDPEDDYATLQDALNALATTDNIEIIVDDGHADNAMDVLAVITGANMYIHQAGTGTRPTHTYADGAATGFKTFLTMSGENGLIEGLAFAESNGNMGAGNDGTLSLGGIVHTGRQGAVVNCAMLSDDATYWIKTGYAPNSGSEGFLVLKSLTETTYAYAFITGDAEVSTVIGCTFGRGVTEACCRTLPGAKIVNFSWDRVANDGFKSCIRFWAVDYGFQFGCYLSDGDNWLGDNIGNAETATTVRIDCNFAEGATSAAGLIGFPMEPDVSEVFVCNNIQRSAANGKITCYYDMSATHNTCVSLAGYAGTLARVEFGGADTYFSNNLIIHENPADIDAPPGGKTALQVDPDTAEVSGNVIPVLVASSDVRISDDGAVGTLETLDTFNARPFASGNEARDITLDANYADPSPKTVTTFPGVHFDYYGAARGPASWAGAVGSAPSPPPGEALLAVADCRPGMLTAAGDLKPSLVNSTYTGGDGTAENLKPSLLDGAGNLKPGWLNADGSRKSSNRAET